MSIYSRIDKHLINVGEWFEEVSRQNRRNGLPQYTHFTVPIYKACVDKVGTVAATGISFLAAELVMHQLLGNAVICAGSYMYSPILPDAWQEYLFKDACSFSIITPSLLWCAAVGTSVMYAKFRRS